ncbi:scaffolding-like protein [Burkholderia phage AMP1]|uniref:Scaffolding-like protein n=5 Tax=Ampunavirus BpAMP1 TaxID=2733589 RepID=A0A5C2IBI2_9CAUD|nr:head scaffolding protein [Burkholderia phage Bp-AMP1]QEP52859.1 scaffolding-like protein [Burkholderia phage AMP1]CDL65189.1 Scaffolding-like protein [Burkholderia phage Bp-AMP2]CDL65229.1 Scaffolding-like protein [Burkholderia phage Bp-AMP3]CDL65269.1 Scaffolding-like protein [Burkholderia phage Bp-AMP4]CDK30103.1 Scaffolding-like protein [Burkholderia phage Bp-AMP1]
MTTEVQTAVSAPAPAAPAAAPAAPATPAPAPAAPAAAPATPATPAAPANAATTETGTFGEVVSYQPTGDSNLDLALGFVGKHGLGPEHPAIAAATKGDFGPLKALMAEKNVPGWEAHIALAEKGYADYARTEADKVAAVQNICVSAAGGEQEWGEVLTWASANAEPHEKEQVNAALAQGGVVAEAVAAFLVNSYRGAAGVTYEPRESAVRPEAARGAAAATGGALSPADYGKAVAELRGRLGVRFDQSPEYRQLQQRRAMYRG